MRIKILIILSVLLPVLSGCSVGDKDREEMYDVLDIRTLAMNKGDRKGMDYVLHPDYPEREKILNSLTLGTSYYRGVDMTVRDRQVVSYNPVLKKAVVKQIFDIVYLFPEGHEKERNEFRNMAEDVVMKKTEHGWKIADGLK